MFSSFKTGLGRGETSGNGNSVQIFDSKEMASLVLICVSLSFGKERGSVGGACVWSMGGGGGCDGETSGVGILEPQLRKKKTVGIKAKASSFLCIIGVKKKASKRKARHLDVPRPTQTGGMIRDSYIFGSLSGSVTFGGAAGGISVIEAEVTAECPTCGGSCIALVGEGVAGISAHDGGVWALMVPASDPSAVFELDSGGACIPAPVVFISPIGFVIDRDARVADVFKHIGIRFCHGGAVRVIPW